MIRPGFPRPDTIRPLATKTPFTQNLPTESGGGRVSDVRFAFRELACGLGDGGGGLGVDPADERMGLHRRAATSLHGRRIPSLQFGDPEYLPHHRLHGATPIAAVASMPGSVHIIAWAGGLRRRARFRCVGGDAQAIQVAPAEAAQGRSGLIARWRPALIMIRVLAVR